MPNYKESRGLPIDEGTEEDAHPAGEDQDTRESKITACNARAADFGAKIVVVDDQRTNLDIISKYLETAGYRSVLTLDEPRKALDVISKESPDVVILDVIMPGVGGIEILRRMRATPNLASIPVIIFTAADDRDIKLLALETGASDFLSKPLDPCELNARVRNLLLLKRQRDQLRRYSIELEKRFAEARSSKSAAERNARLLESVNGRLVRMTKKACHENRAKSEFLASMSHEIRTPMTAILGYADILAGTLESRSAREAAQTIKRNGEYLLDLINDILDFSKIEAGKLTVERIPCNPSQVVGEVVSLLKVRAEEKGLSLDINFETPIPETIHSDPTRLQQILMNLVGNAVKFTENGCVRIVARLLASAEEPKLQFDVVDTGIGMTTRQIGKLFRPYSQADSSTTRSFGGSGLGLVISQRLADALGGDIAVKSAVNAGSTFRLTVPAGHLTGVQMLESPRMGSESPPYSPGESLVETSLEGCNILLAEDGPDNQRLISFLLRKAGAEVTCVENGQEAVARASQCEFDLVLMDIQMPIMDGYQATRSLRDRGYQGHIIALTAHSMPGDIQKCLDSGCDAFMSKPIHREKLLEDVLRYVRRQAGETSQCEAEAEPLVEEATTSL